MKPAQHASSVLPTRYGCAVVLGGYVNGYSIIRDLIGRGVPRVWLLDSSRSLSSRSNKIDGFSLVQWEASSLGAELRRLSERFGRLVLYPTNDAQLEVLGEIYDDVVDFCFLPFNRKGLQQAIDKNFQYAECKRLGIPFPHSVELSTVTDLDRLKGLVHPLLIKPRKRDDMKSDVFRSLLLQKPADLDANRDRIATFIRSGTGFIASELVPGDDTRIYAYTAYRSACGEILGEWVGKKLTQYPDCFGVFSSASNEAPDEVREQGRRLIEGMGLKGIVEPEFKFDARDGSLKLMEINLRSMMWHRVGSLSGVNLPYLQWLDANSEPVPPQKQERSRKIHFVYMKHEWSNVLSRRGYFRHFINNIFGGDERHFALFDMKDVKPFFHDLRSYPSALVHAWLKRLKIR